MAAEKFLPPVDLTTSGRPVLLPNEIECSLLSSVDLESDELPAFPLLKSGLLILTTHRLLWIPESSSAVASSSASAIPLSAITHIFSPKKSLRSVFASPRIRFQLSVLSDGRGVGSGPGSRSVAVTVVARGKGECDAFTGSSGRAGGRGCGRLIMLWLQRLRILSWFRGPGLVRILVVGCIRVKAL